MSFLAYVCTETLTFNLHISPEEFPATAEIAANHMYEAHTVVQGLHIDSLCAAGSAMMVDERWQSAMAKQHEWVCLQILKQEVENLLIIRSDGHSWRQRTDFRCWCKRNRVIHECLRVMMCLHSISGIV